MKKKLQETELIFLQFIRILHERNEYSLLLSVCHNGPTVHYKVTFIETEDENALNGRNWPSQVCK